MRTNPRYTAISIYVVGSKLQGYGTRPKGGMGRLELILGFRGCRREMDMEAENTFGEQSCSADLGKKKAAACLFQKL